MQARRAILTKRDSREYKSDPVPADVEQRILQAGRMAGSSKNTQPWAFVVLKDQQAKEALAGCGNFAKHVPSAPLVVAVVLKPGGGGFDAGRAAQNMMLAAWAEGVTSCPVAMHDQACAAKKLGIPEGHSVPIVLSFGYPTTNESLHRGIARTALDDLLHYDRW
jgi:nitroreductase